MTTKKSLKLKKLDDDKEIKNTISKINKQMSKKKSDAKDDMKEDVKYLDTVNTLASIYTHIDRKTIVFAVTKCEGNERMIYDYLDNYLINFEILIPKIMLFSVLPLSIMSAYKSFTNKTLKITNDNLMKAIKKICVHDRDMKQHFTKYQRTYSFEHDELLNNDNVITTIDLEFNKLKNNLVYCRSAIPLHEVLGINHDEAYKQVLMNGDGLTVINKEFIEKFD